MQLSQHRLWGNAICATIYIYENSTSDHYHYSKGQNLLQQLPRGDIGLLRPDPVSNKELRRQLYSANLHESVDSVNKKVVLNSACWISSTLGVDVDTMRSVKWSSDPPKLIKYTVLPSLLPIVVCRNLRNRIIFFRPRWRLYIIPFAPKHRASFCNRLVSMT